MEAKWKSSYNPYKLCDTQENQAKVLGAHPPLYNGEPPPYYGKHQAPGKSQKTLILIQAPPVTYHFSRLQLPSTAYPSRDR